MMKICFFTMYDDKYVRHAMTLVSSGVVFRRPILAFRIPTGEDWTRYKIKLFLGDELPAAKKYVYMDADCILSAHGDWESRDCVGVADMTALHGGDYRHTLRGFHSQFRDEENAWNRVVELFHKAGRPVWCNSGVVVLREKDRKPFAKLWMKWCKKIDSFCDSGTSWGDEVHLMFARQEYGLPILPTRFNGLCKWQSITPEHVVIHADGNVTGDKAKPYHDMVRRVFGRNVFAQ